MSRALAVLRPEPGNAATVARARAAGFDVIALPLFELRALDWEPPDPRAFDALVLTSANSLRFGGAALARYTGLRVHAVGDHTAAAAVAAGFSVAGVGNSDAAALIEQIATAKVTRALHLSGRERTIPPGGPIATIVPVYANEPRDPSAAELASLSGMTALLHSAQAARRLGMLVDQAALQRGSIALAAFSPAVAIAAGAGWAALEVAAEPADAALFTAARRIAPHPPR